MKGSIRRGMLGIALVGILALAAVPAYAVDYDFSGTFQNDNDRVFFFFTVGGTTASDVTVFSSSWLYGNPPTGAGLGGFDPILSIWTASGDRMYQQDDGYQTGSTASNGVYYDHGTWDSYFTVTLNPGDYIAAVTQYSNFANTDNLADGFYYDNNPNFTYDNGYGYEAMFNGVWGGDRLDPRTGDWEFHLLNVAAADVRTDPVPEPGTLVLLGSALGGLPVYLRRRVKK